MNGNNNWRPAPGQQAEQPVMDGFPGWDWRSHLCPDSRQRIVNKILDTLKRHLPFSGPEGLHELKKIAVRFEEKIYTAATSQSDYLRKISLKMLTMESNSQTTMGNALLPSQVPNNSPKTQLFFSQIPYPRALPAVAVAIAVATTYQPIRSYFAHSCCLSLATGCRRFIALQLMLLLLTLPPLSEVLFAGFYCCRCIFSLFLCWRFSSLSSSIFCDFD